MFSPQILGYLTLEPGLILRGQVWRLVTWVIVPPSSLDIFTIIMLFFYYSIGNTLEHTWGAFRYNVYIFTGIIATALGAFLLYFILGGNILFGSALFSTYYINMSIFLAFAAMYPVSYTHLDVYKRQVKASMKPDSTPGMISGKTTEKKAFKGDAPRSRAAS